MAFKVLDIFVPILIHECRSNVCVANNRWIKNKDWKKEAKELGDRIVSVFAHLEDEMTAAPSVCDTITIMSSIIVILLKGKIYLPYFGLSSPTSDHHDESELIRISLRLDDLNRKQSL